MQNKQTILDVQINKSGSLFFALADTHKLYCYSLLTSEHVSSVTSSFESSNYLSIMLDQSGRFLFGISENCVTIYCQNSGEFKLNMTAELRQSKFTKVQRNEQSGLIFMNVNESIHYFHISN